MSLLSAVLEEAQKADIQDLKKQVEQINPRLNDLTERVHILTWSLQENLNNLYLTFAVSESLEQLNYENKKREIVSDYQKLSEEVNSIRQHNEVKDEEFEDCYLKLEKSYLLLNNLCTAAEARKKLISADHDFRRYNYSVALLSVEAIRKDLKEIKLDGEAARAVQKLCDITENQLAMYSAQLSAEWEEVFYWTEQKSLTHVTYALVIQQCNTSHVQKILTTLYSCHRLNAELSNFSHFFIDKILSNIIRHNCEIFTDENLGYILYNIKIDLSENVRPNFHTIFNNLTAVFEFLQSTLRGLFADGHTFISVLAQTIRDRFFNKIINDCIKANLPSCDGSYQNYKNLVSELDVFNKFLIDINFVDATNSPLNKYIEDTECLLYKKKCDKLLSDIRILLSKSLSYGTEIVGSANDEEDGTELNVTDKGVTWNNLDKPLFLPKCVISCNVKQVMEVITQHLKESISLPEKYQNKLVLYMKDIAIMYQCLVPMKFTVNLECCPSDIALFFNNCFYLAHGFLGPPWKNVLPTKFADNLNTVLGDCIQDLRVLGLEKISLYLQKQIDMITNTIQLNDQSLWSYEVYEKFECAISETLNLMQDLKTNWINVLPTKMYVHTMCTLVEALCQSIINRLLTNVQKIDEELVFLIALKIDDTVEQIISLFEEAIDLNMKINIWPKFIKMPKVLKAQLLELSESWNTTKELTTVYTCEEIRQIIKMRYPDDAYRFKILAEIQ